MVGKVRMPVAIALTVLATWTTTVVTILVRDGRRKRRAEQHRRAIVRKR
jgi:hypothetical protein